MVRKMYGFWSLLDDKGLWGMGYCGPMGFASQIPVHRVGGMELLWDIRGYGLSGVWIMRGSTVQCIYCRATLVRLPTPTTR
jgi:hypothetical protein